MDTKSEQKRTLEEAFAGGEVYTGSLYRRFYVRFKGPMPEKLRSALPMRNIRIPKPKIYLDGTHQYEIDMEVHEFQGGIFPEPSTPVTMAHIVDPRSSREYMRRAADQLELAIQTDRANDDGDHIAAIRNNIIMAASCIAGNDPLWPESDGFRFPEPDPPGLEPDRRSAREYLRRAYKGLECAVGNDTRPSQSSVVEQARMWLESASACLRGSNV